MSKHGHAGKKPTRTYNAWVSMKKRCNYSKTNGYNRYGGSGINVCERWQHSFENFLLDMGECPSIDHSLDRFPNRKGNYKPGNCRWATQEEQIANMDRTVTIVYNNEIIPLFILAKRFNLSSKLLYKRVISMKWDINKALTTAKMQNIKWGIFCSKIKYLKSNLMFDHLQKLMNTNKIPLAKATTNGLTKSVLLIKHAKYKTPDRIYAGASN